MLFFLLESLILGRWNYARSFILDYDPLTPENYQNTVLDQNVNQVFSQKDRPYPGWKSVVEAAKGSYPTFYGLRQKTKLVKMPG